MKVLLSIKPVFADRIFDGTKKFEYRKTIFKNKGIKTVVVYASSPIQRVIGEFEIESILDDNLDNLWKQTKQHSGINKEYFYQYFSAKKRGFAIKIKSTKLYEKPLNLQENYKILPPQSFQYIQ
jgi:predicted transcriptional regulator